MKTIQRLLTALLLLIAIDSSAQYVAIPDTGFGRWLSNTGYCMTGSSAAGWQMDTTCPTIINEVGLVIAGYNIHNLQGIRYFKHLQQISMTNSPVTSLSVLPVSLKYLSLYNCQLDTLPVLPDSVTYLQCNNSLRLTGVLALPSHLATLRLENNVLTSLPVLPASIQTLYCDGNYLTALPTLPDSLTFMECGYNSLTSLPAFPAKLKTLQCRSNQLTTLPSLPGVIYSVDLANNRLTSLPALPASLYALSVSYNRITYLPTLPSRLRVLYCDSNRLNFLPSLPDTLTTFACGNNARLICMPDPLPYFVNTPYIMGVGITCVADHGSGNNSVFLSYPICTNGNCSGLGGPNLTVCQYDAVMMQGQNSTGVWTALSGNPSTTIIPTPGNPVTFIIGFTVAGTYRFAWTSGGVPDTVQVTVTAKPDAGADQSISAVIPGGSTPLSAVGTGTWSAAAGNPGNVTITTPASPNSTVTNFTAVGAYKFVWNVGGCTDTVTVYVSSPCGLTASQRSGCTGYMLNLQDTATGTSNTNWSILDPYGNTIHYNNNPQASHLMNIPGVYTVTMTNSLGCNIIDSNFRVYGKPHVQGTLSNTIAGVNECIYWQDATYTDDAACAGLSYLIDWGQGTPQTTPGACHPYTATGVYDINIIVTNACGCVADTILTGAVTIVRDSAGPDQDICLGVTTVTMAATGVGVWTPLVPYPGTGMADTTVPHTIVMGFPHSGVYTYIWTTASGSDTMNITVHDNPIVVTDTLHNVSCNGTNDGLICVHATGGASSYTYLWSNFSTSTCAQNLPPGVYYVIVEDFYGCWALDTFTITGPAPIVISASITNTHCFGGSDGAIAATASGPGGTFTYQWTPGGLIGPQISGLPTGNYCLTVTNSMMCSADSCFTVGQPAAIIVTDTVQNVSCTGASDGEICTMFTGGTPPYTYLWSNGQSGNVSCINNLSAITYAVTVTDGNGCTGSMRDSLISNNNCVWPGDANADLVVDNNDLLNIGVGYDSTGPVRTVQGIVWQADASYDWQWFFGTTVNYKHADCNGDGIIDANDTTAIIQNFGLIHPKTNGTITPWRAGIPGLKVVLSEDTMFAGDTVTATFILGDSATPVNNIYGLAFTYNFDPGVVDSAYTDMTFGNSWLGSTDKISLSKSLNDAGLIKAGVTRIDHTTRTGYGMIARAKFKITTDNISGKDLAYYANVGFISDIKAIDNTGNTITLNAGADSGQVAYEPTGVREIAKERVSLYPNPAKDHINISADNVIKEIMLTDIMGQEVIHTNANGRVATINVSTCSSGLYIVQVKTEKGVGVVKLTIGK